MNRGKPRLDTNEPKHKPIVCISTIDWDFQRQRHQILMSGLAARGYAVAFVENLGGRSPRWVDAGRIISRIANITEQVRYGPRREEGVDVISPFVLPPPYGNSINHFLMIPRLARQIRRRGYSDAILWTYSATPSALRLIELLRPRAIVYDCVTDLRAYEYATAALLKSEGELVARADAIVTDAKRLLVEMSSRHPATYRIEPGVDFEQFAARTASEPATLAGMPHPRLGFFGTVGWWLDLDLLENFASTRPDWTVVVIGAVKCDVSRLAERRNVNFIGAVPHDALPSYIAFLDVLCLPYKINDFNSSVFPAKTFEALASGKPIIGTAIPELVELSDVITIVDSANFVSAVESALRHDSAAKRRARKDVAARNSWTARLDQAESIILRLCSDPRSVSPSARSRSSNG